MCVCMCESVCVHEQSHLYYTIRPCKIIYIPTRIEKSHPHTNGSVRERLRENKFIK